MLLFKFITAGVLFLLFVVLLLIWSADDLFPERYPVRADFSLNYGGEHSQITHYTVVTRRSNNFFLSLEVGKYRWDPGRRGWSLPLADGASLILWPEWPSVFQNLKDGIVYNSIGHWLWVDNGDAPKKMVFGGGATRPWSSTDLLASVALTKVDSTIERTSESFLSEARKSDGIRDTADKLAFSNFIGRQDFNYKGALFTAVTISPVISRDAAGSTKLEQLKSAPDWISTAGNCRVRSLVGTDVRLLDTLRTYSESVWLVDRNGVWNGDIGPHPGGPFILYSTGEEVESGGQANWSAPAYRELALRMIHAVEWHGESCSGIQPIAGTSAEVVQFPSGRLAMLSPTDTLVVWRN